MSPSTPQQPSPTPEIPTPIKISYVQMQNGSTVYQTQPAVLLWGRDNTITLLDTATNTVVFSTPPQGIRKFSGSAGYLRITLQDARYFSLIFDINAINNQAKGAIGGQFGVIGGAYAIKKGADNYKAEQIGDSLWWAQSLKKFSVKGIYVSTKTLAWISVGTTVVVLLIIFVSVAISLSS